MNRGAVSRALLAELESNEAGPRSYKQDASNGAIATPLELETMSGHGRPGAAAPIEREPVAPRGTCLAQQHRPIIAEGAVGDRRGVGHAGGDAGQRREVLEQLPVVPRAQAIAVLYPVVQPRNTTT